MIRDDAAVWAADGCGRVFCAVHDCGEERGDKICCCVHLSSRRKKNIGSGSRRQHKASQNQPVNLEVDDYHRYIDPDTSRWSRSCTGPPLPLATPLIPTHQDRSHHPKLRDPNHFLPRLSPNDDLPFRARVGETKSSQPQNEKIPAAHSSPGEVEIILRA